MDELTAAQRRHDPQAGGFTSLEALIARTRTCCLRPFRFFVSWQGVLTLAYTCVLPPKQVARMIPCIAFWLRFCCKCLGRKGSLA